MWLVFVTTPDVGASSLANTPKSARKLTTKLTKLTKVTKIREEVVVGIATTP
jgi:hypothetical protein